MSSMPIRPTPPIAEVPELVQRNNAASTALAFFVQLQQAIIVLDHYRNSSILAIMEHVSRAHANRAGSTHGSQPCCHYSTSRLLGGKTTKLAELRQLSCRRFQTSCASCLTASRLFFSFPDFQSRQTCELGDHCYRGFCGYVCRAVPSCSFCDSWFTQVWSASLVCRTCKVSG